MRETTWIAYDRTTFDAAKAQAAEQRATWKERLPEPGSALGYRLRTNATLKTNPATLGVAQCQSLPGDPWYLSLDRSAAAREHYDATKPDRDRILAEVLNEEQAQVFFEAEEAAARLVVEAFADDTADRNNRETVLQCVTVRRVREACSRYPEKVYDERS